MGDLINYVEFFDGNLVDLIQNVYAWDVNAIPFNHIDQILGCSIIFEGDVGVMDFIFAQYRLYRFRVELALWDLKM